MPFLHQGFRQMIDWFERAQIDYREHFLTLYIAYNAWYREVTGLANDRAAIQMLKKRFVIWDDYIQHRTMERLGCVVEKIAEITQRNPLRISAVMQWSGEVAGRDDWRSLIEYWYYVRCTIVHGGYIDERHAYLAYESLGIFMEEIIGRVKMCIEGLRTSEADELTRLAQAGAQHTERFVRLQQKLYLKYKAMPSVREVDMQRV
ncbi:hypothetical protein KI440_01880 [Candidatus Saccharibacteria bacterium TM7i]|nr:hypothetical protein KI440_01880 [Candidatus Saccharibacteria bacterium TM7i]